VRRNSDAAAGREGRGLVEFELSELLKFFRSGTCQSSNNRTTASQPNLLLSLDMTEMLDRSPLIFYHRNFESMNSRAT
jgi:hypothetical protein